MDLRQKLADMGYFGITIPEEYGGLGLGIFEYCLICEQLARGFERLTLEHRSVLVLRLYLGFSLEETAATLGIPAGTAKSRLHYALAAMRLTVTADADVETVPLTAGGPVA